MTANQIKKQQIAILMLNMGGPSKLEDVGPFLNRLFSDKDIMKLPFQRFVCAKLVINNIKIIFNSNYLSSISMVGPYLAKRRTSAVQKKYSEIGGGSPILKWTNIQGEKLIEELNSSCSSYGIFKHYVGFRYADPLTEEAIDKIKE